MSRRTGVWADLAALADGRAALEDRAGPDYRVAADRHPCLQSRCARLEEGDTRAGVPLDQAPLDGLLGVHQADPVVHADRRIGVVGHVRGDGAAVLADHREHAGEVALLALEPDLVERLEQRVRVEDVGAEIDLAGGELVLRQALGVLRLEDALDVAVAVADDPPEARRIDPVGGQQRGDRALPVVLLEEPQELRAGDERLVRGQDDHGRGSPPPAPLRRARRRERRARPTPVPSPSRCSTTSTPSGSPSATPSPGLTTATTRSAPASRAASTTHSTSVLPATR